MAKAAQKTGSIVVNGIVEDARLAPGSVDAVAGFGSFIQIRDPLSTLKCLNIAMKHRGRILLDSPNDASLFRALARFLYRFHGLVSSPKLATFFEEFLRLVYNPGRFYYYTPKTLGTLLSLAGFDIIDVEMRKSRYLLYGEVDLPLFVGSAARIVSLAEKISRRQSWFQISAVKTREL